MTPGIMGRGTNDGVNHPTHLYAMKYVGPNWSFLDVGCGSGTTYEALKNAHEPVRYMGVDNDIDYIKWCCETFPEVQWDVQDAICLKEEDQSWDVIFSRGTIENLPSFEECIREWTRVARKLVIIWFWNGLIEGKTHSIQRHIYNNTLYPEHANKYAKDKIIEELKEFPNWKIVELNQHPFKEILQPYDVLIIGKI